MRETCKGMAGCQPHPRMLGLCCFSLGTSSVALCLRDLGNRAGHPHNPGECLG